MSAQPGTAAEQQTCTLALQAGGSVVLHRHRGCVPNHTHIRMRALLKHEHVQGSSRPSDLTPAQSRRSPGPCRAQSLPGFSAGPLLWGCISCFRALAVGLLITLEDERSEALPF